MQTKQVRCVFLMQSLEHNLIRAEITYSPVMIKTSIILIRKRPGMELDPYQRRICIADSSYGNNSLNP
jgi:hypothetical protein